MLLVYLVGVILSLVKLNRIPKPAALALVGFSMALLSNAMFPFVQGYIIVSREYYGWSSQQLDMYMWLVGVVRTLLHVIASSLILAAIFTGRTGLARSGSTADTVPETAYEATRQPHRASVVLVLGILSLIACAPLGIVAWVMGRNDLTAMRSGRMDRSGESLTGLGQILGIIGTMLFGLGIVGGLLWLTVVGTLLTSR
jgi:xanthosine utilization system XapX-like protein